MASQAPQPVAVTKMDDWSRVYVFDFTDSFVEFGAPSPPTIVGNPTVAADSGITATYLSSVGAKVAVRIAGGSAGNGYNVFVSIVLSTGDQLSLPALVTVSAPGAGGIPQQALGKLPYWERHYKFPFGKVFAEFALPTTTLTGTPVFTCLPANDGSVLGGMPVISGTDVIVFVAGGNPGQTYQVRVTATTSAGDTLSIPGLIAD